MHRPGPARANNVCCLSGLRPACPHAPSQDGLPYSTCPTDPPYPLPLPVAPSAKRTLSCPQPMSSIHPLFGLALPLVRCAPPPARRRFAARGAPRFMSPPALPFQSAGITVSPWLLVLTVCVFPRSQPPVAEAPDTSPPCRRRARPALPSPSPSEFIAAPPGGSRSFH